MPITVQAESPDHWVLRISGVLRKQELEAAETSALRGLEQAGKIRTMVVLENFAGWARGEDWSDLGFYLQHRDRIVKIAIVGDPKWEGEALVFLGAGIRRAPVKFFPAGQEQLARVWLG